MRRDRCPRPLEGVPIRHNAPRATNFVEALSAGWRRLRGGSAEQFWALKEATFQVAQGEVIGIIGHNGAGKSTLLKILSRIVEPTSGDAVLRGRLGSLLEVGTGFHPDLTGRENIFLNGAMLGMSRAVVQRQFDDIVEFSGVEQFLDTPVKRYSSGMYVGWRSRSPPTSTAKCSSSTRCSPWATKRSSGSASAR